MNDSPNHHGALARLFALVLLLAALAAGVVLGGLAAMGLALSALVARSRPRRQRLRPGAADDVIEGSFEVLQGRTRGHGG